MYIKNNWMLHGIKVILLFDGMRAIGIRLISMSTARISITNDNKSHAEQNGHECSYTQSRDMCLYTCSINLLFMYFWQEITARL